MIPNIVQTGSLSASDTDYVEYSIRCRWKVVKEESYSLKDTDETLEEHVNIK